jgi:DtxR family Mn-dependent transcriptional regulator
VSDLIDTTEMYLRTIFELEEEGIVPLRARIAERLGHSGPTVSQTVARMERDGLLSVSGDRHLELTEGGRTKAMRVMRKHRLAERLLLDVIGLEWEFVHDEACRWEHVMSERVERKLLGMLVDPRESPYGNPIPGLEELGGPPSGGAGFRDGLMPLPDALLDALPAPAALEASLAAAAGGAPVGPAGQAGPIGSPGSAEPAAAEAVAAEAVALVVRRIGEPVQTDIEVMGRLAAAGLRPGSGVSATRRGDTLRVHGEGGSIDLPLSVAQHVFVARAGQA